jgi:hypothetical protein
MRKKICFEERKKGQLFSILAILILSLMFLSYELYSYLNERQVVETRVSTMESFLNSVEENLARQMYIVGFRILFLATAHITSTGEYVDVDSFFNEAFFNGTIGGEENDFLLGATYNDLVDSLNEKGNNINVEIVLSNTSISVSQSDPWFVNFSMISDFVMEDKEGLARWERKQIISGMIPVVGLEDPVYAVNSYSKISRKISRTIYEGNYANGTDVTNLLSHVNNNYYAANPDAPSYLDRLEGNFSADPEGIESFVNLGEFSSQGIPIYSKSCVDHIYFSDDNPGSSPVSGMPSWFRIDNSHLAKYNLTG